MAGAPEIVAVHLCELRRDRDRLSCRDRHLKRRVAHALHDPRIGQHHIQTSVPHGVALRRVVGKRAVIQQEFDRRAVIERKRRGIARIFHTLTVDLIRSKNVIDREPQKRIQRHFLARHVGRQSFELFPRIAAAVLIALYRVSLDILAQCRQIMRAILTDKEAVLCHLCFFIVGKAVKVDGQEHCSSRIVIARHSDRRRGLHRLAGRRERIDIYGLLERRKRLKGARQIVVVLQDRRIILPALRGAEIHAFGRILVSRTCRRSKAARKAANAHLRLYRFAVHRNSRTVFPNITDR